MSLIERLILGCARLTGGASAGEAEALVRVALDAGVGHIDTAPSYGMGTAEAVVGRALSRFGGPVKVTAKLGSARDPHALAKSWMRRVKRAVSGAGGDVWRDAQAPVARMTGPSGNDFGHEAMRASLEISRERLGRIDFLLLHDVTAGEMDATLLAGLNGLAANVGAVPGYASQAHWDAELDGRFPERAAGQFAATPEWFSGGAAVNRTQVFLHSVVKAGAFRRLRDTGFAERLDRAARAIGSGDGDGDRIAALYAAIGFALPEARLVVASSHRQRLQAVLRAVGRVDALGRAGEIADLLAMRDGPNES